MYVPNAVTFYFCITWLPTYLVKERGLSVGDMGMFMTILSVGMFIGYQIFGWLAGGIGKPWPAPAKSGRPKRNRRPAMRPSTPWPVVACSISGTGS